MVGLKIIFILLVAILLGCENNSNVLPTGDLKYLEKYHCWPYDVNVYSIDDVKIDSIFYCYPLRSYFGKNTKYKVTTWTKYDEIDTTVWSGMKRTLKECDNNTMLYNQLLEGNNIYYSGLYQTFEVLKGKRRRKYEKILFLDLVNRRLHIFKDINKIY